MFLLIAFGTLQPVRGLMAHDAGDFTAEIELPYPVTVVLHTDLVAIRGRAG